MRIAIAMLALAVAAGCGYVGAPLPPALNIPERVATVNASQQAGELVVGLIVTGRMTDGLVSKRLREIELRAGPAAASLDAWAEAARRIPVEPAKPGALELRTAVAGWEDRDVQVGVRVVGPTGRAGAWSELRTVHIVLSPRAPEVELSTTAQGVLLRWSAAGAAAGTKWRILRQGKDDEKPQPAGEASVSEWLDTAAAVDGSEFAYQLQTVAPAGKGLALSDPSKLVNVVYKDVFPPAPPRGLTALVSVNSVELTWEPNRESDLKGYQVWRAEGAGALARLGALSTEISASDTGIAAPAANAAAPRRYRYAVSAIDLKGNESAPCPAVEVSLP